MSRSENRKHFIVKHGLDAFEALPNIIWRTDKGPTDVPHRFDQVKEGSRWIAFAYTTSDSRERPLSLVTGFYECIRERDYLKIPAAGLPISDVATKAWIIEGKQFGKRLSHPVGVPPLDDLLGRPHFKSEALVPISSEEFQRIYDYTLGHQFNTEKIPLLGRQPTCEQEVLSIVVSAHKKIGIEKIIQVHKAFPDLLVKLEGHPQEVYLELEVYSQGFFSHAHDKQVRNRRFTKDNIPVAVLCWVDDNKRVKDSVHRVYELQSLIREGKKIVW